MTWSLERVIARAVAAHAEGIAREVLAELRRQVDGELPVAPPVSPAPPAAPPAFTVEEPMPKKPMHRVFPKNVKSTSKCLRTGCHERALRGAGFCEFHQAELLQRGRARAAGTPQG